MLPNLAEALVKLGWAPDATVPAYITAMRSATEPFLALEGVSQRFAVSGGLFAPPRTLNALADVDLALAQGETLVSAAIGRRVFEEVWGG
jgi:hypothetical protein